MVEHGDIEGLIRELRARVEERRAGGEYPDGLERDLDRHFREVVARGVHDPVRRFHTALAEAERTAEMRAEAIPADSEVPGGRLVHRAVARLVGRQVEGVLMQAREHARASLEVHRAELFAISELATRLDELRARVSRAWSEAGDEAGDAGAARAAIADLRARVDELELVAATQRPDPWAPATAGEPPTSLVDAMVERFGGAGTVAAFGPAESIAGLLRERGVEIEIVSGSAAATLGALDAIPPGGLDGALVSHVVETLRPDEQLALVARLADRLRPGSPLAVLAVDPQASAAAARPVAVAHPAYLMFLFTEAGFEEVTVRWPDSPPGPTGDGTTGSEEAAVERLRSRLFGADRYVLGAVR